MGTATGITTRHRARLTGQGQITVPKAVRDALGARPGDDIEFVPTEAGLFIELRQRRNVLDFAGIAADAVSRVPASAGELDALVREGMKRASVERATDAKRRSRGSR